MTNDYTKLNYIDCNNKEFDIYKSLKEKSNSPFFIALSIIAMIGGSILAIYMNDQSYMITGTIISTTGLAGGIYWLVSYCKIKKHNENVERVKQMTGDVWSTSSNDEEDEQFPKESENSAKNQYQEYLARIKS